MNKTLKWILISSAILIAVGGIFIGIGKMLGGVLSSGFFRVGGKTFSAEDFRTETIDIDDFTSLEVSTSFIDIEIVKGDRPGLEVYAPEICMPEVSQNGGHLKIEQPKQTINFQINLNTSPVSAYYKITVPEDAVLPSSISATSGDITITDVNVSGDIASTSGDKEISGINADNLNITATSGDCDLNTCTLDTLNLCTTSGFARIDSITAKEFEYSTTSGGIDSVNCNLTTIDSASTSGDVRYENLEAETVVTESTSGNFFIDNSSVKSLSATSTSGEFESSKLTSDNIQIDGTSADIELSLTGKESEYDYTIDSVSGDISLPSLEVEKKYHTNNGKDKTIEVNTTSGDIKIKF